MKNFLSELFWRMGRRLIIWSEALEPKKGSTFAGTFNYAIGYRYSLDGEVVVPNQPIKVEDRS